MSSVELLQSYLGQVVRVRISDGRIIEGEFQCVDKDLNFIIGSAIEYRGVEDGNY